MAYEFKLPDIGEGVVEGEIVSWKIAVGDRIVVDQPLVEVMTDKATVEIPSPRAGVVQRLGFKEGDICPVGAVLVVIDEGGKPGSSAGTTLDQAPSANPAVVPTGEPAAQARHEQHGRKRPESDDRPTMRMTMDGAVARERVKATPATRRLARELGVELAQVDPTGKRGRVTTDDVRRVIDTSPTQRGFERQPATQAPTQRVAPRPDATRPAAAQQAQAQHSDEPTLVTMRVPDSAAPPAPVREYAPVAVASQGAEERIPLRGLRKRIADNMLRSKHTAAHFTYVEEVDMTELVEVRDRAKQRAAERGLKLTFLPFLIKAVVSGLKRWPQLNASLDETTQEIVRKKYYNVGIASQGPQGLVVTVLRDADRRSIFDLAAEIQRLAQAVQAGNVRREDLTGSTFTITSLGKLGGVMATPIINFPEVGIIGVHEMKQRPAVHNGEIVIRWLMNLSISLDHRLVDGWDGAMFLQEVKALLEDPTTMFLEMV
jgi:pyruvate dehydrogenase E2 component (dihydrolipoamide acetyltransferase)